MGKKVKKKNINTNALKLTHFFFFFSPPCSSMNIVCPNCGQQVQTRVVNKITDNGITVFVVLLIIGILLFWPALCCACIPFCSSSFRETVHFCPSCNKKLGTKKP